MLVPDPSNRSSAKIRPGNADLDLHRFGGLGPDEVRIEREELWEERIQLLAKEANVDLAQLAPRKSAPQKVLLAAALKESTSVSNGSLSQRLGVGETASASQFVRRLLLTLKGGGRSRAFCQQSRHDVFSVSSFCQESRHDVFSVS